MIKRITALFFVLMFTIFSPTSIGGQYIPIKGPNLELNYDLPPGTPNTLVNYWVWKVEGECKMFIQKSDASAENIDEPATIDFFAKVKAGTVAFKDINLSNNQSQTVKVPLNEYVKMSATSGAMLELTNQSKHFIIASCRS